MKIFPQKNYTYKSKYTKTEVLDFLKNNIEKEKPFAVSLTGPNYTKPYIGQILFNKFDIKRVIKYRNSFLPQITGEVIDEGTGSTIEVKMDLNMLIKVFIGLWLGIVGLVCIGATAAIILTTIKLNIAMIAPYFMFLFGFFLVKLPFNFECKRSTTDLAMILKATIN